MGSAQSWVKMETVEPAGGERIACCHGMYAERWPVAREVAYFVACALFCHHCHQADNGITRHMIGFLRRNMVEISFLLLSFQWVTRKNRFRFSGK
ncbi:MAG: hypothetical protein FWD79_00630 [Desulfobulbus sp.]|nr:hypothetical protein [Desulfobulbus sp.]